MEVEFWRYLVADGLDALPLKQRIPDVVAVWRSSATGLECLECFGSDPQRGVLRRWPQEETTPERLLERLLDLVSLRCGAGEIDPCEPTAILRRKADFSGTDALESSRPMVLSAAEVSHLLKNPESAVPLYLGVHDTWSLQSLVTPTDDLRVLAVYSCEETGVERVDLRGMRFRTMYRLGDADALLSSGSSSSSTPPIGTLDVPEARSAAIEAKVLALVRYVRRFHTYQVEEFVGEFVLDASNRIILHAIWKVRFSGANELPTHCLRNDSWCVASASVSTTASLSRGGSRPASASHGGSRPGSAKRPGSRPSSAKSRSRPASARAGGQPQSPVSHSFSSIHDGQDLQIVDYGSDAGESFDRQIERAEENAQRNLTMRCPVGPSSRPRPNPGRRVLNSTRECTFSSAAASAACSTPGAWSEAVSVRPRHVGVAMPPKPKRQGSLGRPASARPSRTAPSDPRLRQRPASARAQVSSVVASVTPELPRTETCSLAPPRAPVQSHSSSPDLTSSAPCKVDFSDWASAPQSEKDAVNTRRNATNDKACDVSGVVYSEQLISRHLLLRESGTRLLSTLCRQLERHRDLLPAWSAQHRVVDEASDYIAAERTRRAYELDNLMVEKHRIQKDFELRREALEKGLRGQLTQLKRECEAKQLELEQSKVDERKSLEIVMMEESRNKSLRSTLERTVARLQVLQTEWVASRRSQAALEANVAGSSFNDSEQLTADFDAERMSTRLEQVEAERLRVSREVEGEAECLRHEQDEVDAHRAATDELLEFARQFTLAPSKVNPVHPFLRRDAFVALRDATTHRTAHNVLASDR